MRKSILDGTFNPNAREERSTRVSDRLSDVISASTSVPIILATTLTGLGWLITLPPYGGDQPLEIVDQPLTYAFLGALLLLPADAVPPLCPQRTANMAYVAVAMRIILAATALGLPWSPLTLLTPGSASGRC